MSNNIWVVSLLLIAVSLYFVYIIYSRNTKRKSEKPIIHDDTIKASEENIEIIRKHINELDKKSRDITDSELMDALRKYSK